MRKKISHTLENIQLEWIHTLVLRQSFVLQYFEIVSTFNCTNKRVQQSTDTHTGSVGSQSIRMKFDVLLTSFLTFVFSIRSSSSFFVSMYEETDDQTIDINVFMELFKWAVCFDFNYPLNCLYICLASLPLFQYFVQWALVFRSFVCLFFLSMSIYHSE